MDPVTPRDGATIAHQKHDEGPALMLVHGTLRSRMSAVRTARSAQSSRGRELARRSTATSCRSTSSWRPCRRMAGRAGPASRKAGRR